MIGGDRPGAARARIALGLGLAVALARTPAAHGEPAARLAVRVEAGGCGLALGHPAPADDALRLRVDCPLALDDLLAGVARLLAAAGPALPVPSSLAMGRIVEYPWLSERLARAALADAGWDARRGRPREGHENRAVARLLADRRLLGELAERFAAAGVRLRVAGVEKVLIGAVASTSELSRLAADGVDPGARLPFDAQLWLRLEPLAAAP